jgi:ABC-type transport system involved in multi-copper enzyme maturation permease subunit
MSKVKSHRVYVIFKRDLKEYRSTKALKLVIVMVILAAVVISIWMVLSGDKASSFKLTLCNMLFLFALIPPIVSIPLLTTVPLARDKVNGTIANLLATPLSPKEIVQGKSLAVFLPGYILSALSPLIIVLAVNFALNIPAGGSFYLPVPLFLTVFVITPVFCYELTKFTIQLSMVSSPELAISPSYLIGFALMICVPICSAMGYINLAAWSSLLLFLGATIFIWILVWSFSFLLTKERIILSD